MTGHSLFARRLILGCALFASLMVGVCVAEGLGWGPTLANVSSTVWALAMFTKTAGAP